MPKMLEAVEAFEGGSSLWIMTNSNESRWYQRLNWLTHFKFTDNELHQRPQLSSWLNQLKETCDIRTPEIKDQKILLIPTSTWLPNDWLVLLSHENQNPTEVLGQLKTIWENLKYPTLRFFIPSALKKKDLEEVWRQHKLPQDATWVLEPIIK